VGDTPRNLHIVVRVLVGHCRYLDQMCAEQTQCVLLLLALRIRDNDYRTKAKRVADDREADAGVASRSLDNDAAWLQGATAHCVVDDVKSSAILDGLSGIHELSFAQNFTAGELA